MGRGGCGSDVRTQRDLSTPGRISLVVDSVQSLWKTWNTPSNELLVSTGFTVTGNASHSVEQVLPTAPDTQGSTGGSHAGLQRRAVRPLSAGRFTPAEVALHRQPQDCWLIVKNKVYDVTEFGNRHPGGSVIYTYGGRDATDVFTAFHDSSTWQLLQEYHIGELVAPEPTPELVKDFRELRVSMLRARLYESSVAFYIYKSVSVLSLLVASIALIAANKTLPAVLFSAFLLGLFWQQCGWLAHDFLHHQVFKSRAANDALGGYLFGNVLQGFSAAWWKAKHNTHHAAPNACDEGYHAVDPDIDTLPLLAWSKEMLATVESPRVRAFIRWQTCLFLPILLFARFAWLHSSWTYVRAAKMPERQRAIETALLALHYALFGGAACGLLPLPLAATWLLGGELLSGAFLGIVFVQSHNGMEIYNDAKDFYSAQIVSTRDVAGSVFNDWFTGGLNRQIEHHLFPSLPRHNLHKAASRVKALCKKHGLVYEDVGLARGTSLVLKRLAEVAAFA